MPRAHRHYIAGCIWHITHRCHKKEFLLKFARDRDRWLYWLFQAKKRHNTCILDYTVTSNHIHLLVLDNGSRDVIPKSLQLIAGRTGQEYNQRKNRKGAFWEDRYHATAVEGSDHLIKCLTYIDLNMVRTGVVAHPSQWPWSGYSEIQNPPERYTLIDRLKLMELVGFRDEVGFAEHYRQWVDDALKEDNRQRENRWTESIAVGSREFELREGDVQYHFDGKNVDLRFENSYSWDHMHEISES